MAHLLLFYRSVRTPQPDRKRSFLIPTATGPAAEALRTPSFERPDPPSFLVPVLPESSRKQQPLFVGQLVEIAVGDSFRASGHVAALPSSEFVLMFPDASQEPHGLEAGTPVRVTFWDRLGVHNADTIVTRVRDVRTLTIGVERFSTVTTVQRRRYFRVKAQLPVACAVMPSGNGGETATLQSTTEDVSAGGLRLSTQVPLAPGDRLQVTLGTPRTCRKTLPSSLHAEAKVVRVQEATRDDGRTFDVGVELQFRTEGDRDRWVRLTFALQSGPPETMLRCPVAPGR